MINVTRYDVNEDVETGELFISPVPENIEGPYVAYDDYAALQQKLDAMAAENAALRDVLEDIVEPQSPVLEREHRIRAENALKAQATEAYLNSVRAEGVDLVKSHPAISLVSLTHICDQIAEQLRSGTHDTADKAG